MERGEAIATGSATAILKIQVQIGGPERIAPFVEFDGAAVRDKGCFGRELLSHPRNVLEASVEVRAPDGRKGLADLRLVDHDRNLVAALAFFYAGLDLDIVAVYIGNMHVFSGEFYGVRIFVAHLVLDVAAAFDFPAVIDVAASAQQECDCTEGNTCFFREVQIHAPKLEIIFVLDFQ